MTSRKPLGCFTSIGLLATLVTLALILVAANASGGGIFSPGELNAQSMGMSIGAALSHSELDCSACHPAFWSGISMRDRCLDCHQDVAQELSRPGSLHGSFDSALACQDCHHEHRGSDAALTDFESVHFPHETVGFSLQEHRKSLGQKPFSCMICHPRSVRSFDVFTCRSCHLSSDLLEHIQAFGTACLNCHDGVDRFEQGAFNHQHSAFPLDGAHSSLVCTRCHQDADSIEALRATPQGCASCHADQDLHAGRLGDRCEECHNPVAWEQATIDHDRTRYPLADAHRQIECEACHVGLAWTGLPLDCAGCHIQDDAHQGRYGDQCEACHQPTTWQDVTFDHALSRFPLTGAHQLLECESCHAGGTFAGLSAACVACHADPAYHLGLFSSTCDSCHNTWAWRPTPYNGPHSFPYNHGGAGGTCATCHPSTLTGYTCYSCHEHNQSSIQSKHREEGISNLNDCVRCHPSGREAEGGGGDDDD
jgi:hypothetical protein